MTPPTETRVQDVFDLSSEFIDRMAALRPMAATYQGVTGHDDRWDNLSPEGCEEVRAFLAGTQQRLAALPPAADRWAHLARRVFEVHLDLERSWYDDGEHLVDLNNIASTLQSVRQVFDIMNTSTAQGWEAVAARLETVGTALEGYRRTLESGLRQGKVVSARQVRSAIEQSRVQNGPESFFRRLPGMLAASSVSSAALAARVEAAVPRAEAAFGALADWFEKEYLPKASPKDAVGRERYARMARRYLGMTLNPEETYAWGWHEIHRIEDEIRRVAGEVKAGASPAEVFEILKKDPARQVKDVDTFLRLMTERQHRALRELDGSHFDIPEPIKTVEVKIAPKGGALGAYYIQPTEDFSRPGTVWYALAQDHDIPLYDHISTAYHEGFPGHHLQCGIQVALSDRLSRVHRLAVWYPGYGEGWALYAERLMHELGYFEKPDYVIGMLTAQLFRACRVVIDIGCHHELRIPAEEKSFHPGETWNYDLGVEMLCKRAYEHPDYAKSELVRYLGWPAQAISYKVGEREILKLREELKARQGARFSLKDFHSRVLGSGPLGLDLLREIVLADA